MDIRSLFTPKKVERPKIEEKKTGFKITVSSGLYYIARADEIQTLVKKVGYALTRGTGAIEISSDVPHEIDYSEGWEIRYISEKQGVDLLLHGDLTVPFEMPDRTEWLIAQNKFQKSVKSAVYGGCKYVNFHSCLREWLELFTYAGARLEIVLCDHEGNHISSIFQINGKSNKKLIEWFGKTSLEESPHYLKKFDFVIRYASSILGPDRIERVRRRHMDKLFEEIMKIAREKLTEEELRTLDRQFITKEQKILWLVESKEVIPREEFSRMERRIYRETLVEEVKDVLEKGERWYDEEFKMTRATLDDAYVIIAHHLFLNQDPLWVEMAKMYEDILKHFDYNFDNPLENEDWLSEALDRVNREVSEWSLKFKEFYYGVVASKYLQGHVVKLIEWVQDEKNGLKRIISDELDAINPPNKEEEKKKLFEILKNLKITFENPDARNPELGGRYMLWHPKQIYVAVKHAREVLKGKKKENPKIAEYADKVFMIIDWEHVATQGVDPFHEADDFVRYVKDVSDYIIAIHANYPSPLQPHKPIEIADREVIYRLLWKLREVGLGKKFIVYLLFERGGGEDPFRGSVVALRTIAENLEKDIKPDELPPTFYALPEGTRDYARQKVAIFEHAFEPLKGVLKQPEEEHTLLGSAAIKLGKRPEEWKKEELR